jgi:drug/metabolite transporter (DMT)-like permease
MIRNLLIIVYSNVFSLSQLYLSLPIVQTINCAGPVFTFLADFLYNSVKIDKTQGYSIFIVILGSVFISNKNFILNLFNSLEAKDFH